MECENQFFTTKCYQVMNTFVKQKSIGFQTVNFIEENCNELRIIIISDATSELESRVLDKEIIITTPYNETDTIKSEPQALLAPGQYTESGRAPYPLDKSEKFIQFFTRN